MSDPKNDVLDAYDKSYGGVPANNNGTGAGWMPEDGEHNALMLGFVEDASTFKQSTNQVVVPSRRFRFQFRAIARGDDPATAEQPVWSGAPFNLPVNPAGLTCDKSRTRVEIEVGRLKGHLKAALGPASSGLIRADMEALRAKLARTGAIAVRVRISSRVNGGRTFQTEHVIENLEA